MNESIVGKTFTNSVNGNENMSLAEEEPITAINSSLAHFQAIDKNTT